jgi:hypothetical protein
MPTNPYQPPRETRDGAKAGIASIMWLVIGSAAAAALIWPCLTMSLLALVPWSPAGPGEDPVWAAHYEFQARIVLFSGTSLPLAVIGGVLVMLVGNRRR